MDITITQIDAPSPLLAQVQDLGDCNSDRLGFLPRAVYLKKAAARQILAATAGDTLLGYLMFRVGPRYATIEHLCISTDARKSGTGRQLVQQLEILTSDLDGLDLHCRRDYTDSCAFWCRMGFQPVDEKLGRGKDAMPLTYFVLESAHRGLFHEVQESQVRGRTLVAIDTNIFLDLEAKHEPSTEERRESMSLRADWVSASIVLCVTRELFSDLNNNKNDIERKRLRNVARTYPEKGDSSPEFELVHSGLLRILPAPVSRQDKADYRHLAYAISAEVPFFVTRDDAILRQADELARTFPITVLRPAELITQIDIVRRSAEYEPVLLNGSPIQSRRVNGDEISHLSELFLAYGGGEAKTAFNTELRNACAEPEVSEAVIVNGADGQPAALVVLHRVDNLLEIRLFRVRDNRLSATLARAMAMRAIAEAVRHDCIASVLADEYAPVVVLEALREVGFSRIAERLWKLHLSGIRTCEEIATWLASGREQTRHDEAFALAAALLDDVLAFPSPQRLLDLERRMWPGRVSHPLLPTFIIPVQPRWAEHLFDGQLAAETLFKADPWLALNCENAYYKAAIPAVVSSPARALWYVSKDSARKVQEFRAVSLIEEAYVGTAKELFRQHRRLGVYSWRDLMEMTNGCSDKKIMAVRFTMTQTFERPVAREQFFRRLRERGKPVPPLATAYRTEDSDFRFLYELGTNAGKSPKE